MYFSVVRACELFKNLSDHGRFEIVGMDVKKERKVNADLRLWQEDSRKGEREQPTWTTTASSLMTPLLAYEISDLK